MDNSQTKKILVVEDDDFIRDMYYQELTRAGFFVSAAPNGEEGVKLLQQNTFDLVLLDILMPGMNGLEVLKQIKENPQTQNLKVVLLTNLGQEITIKEGFKMGAIGYLLKASYNPDQIVQEVKNFIDQ